MEDHKPSRRHRLFSGLPGLFHSRSRSASPKPQHKEHEQVVYTTSTTPSKAILRTNQASFQQIKYRLQPKSTFHTNKLALSQQQGPKPPAPLVDSSHEWNNETEPCPASKQPPPQADIIGNKQPGVVPGQTTTKAPRNAYDEAWEGLREDEKASLSSETSIKTLFEKLDETDQQHQSSSWIKRGKMAAGLQYVTNICNYINLVTTWIPVPNLDAALSLFKGIVAIAVGICGAYDALTGYIRQFLDHIPVIERCNTVLWSSSASFDIHNILVACYSTLLSFYSKVMAFLQEERRIKRILETFHSEIPGIVKDFNGHAEKLSKMMEVETLVTVNNIRDKVDQIEEFINIEFRLYKQHHIGSRNDDEGERSDEACRWITSEEAFENWAYGVRGVLTMYGVVGCGKTATASYVAKYLSKELEDAPAPVLAYYFTQQEEEKLQVIYSSLTYQLLRKKTELKEKFMELSEKLQDTALIEGSYNKSAVLAEFLGSALQDSKEQVFVVLDGLDECEEKTRRELLDLFRGLICKGALVKVFVSSRQRDDILQILNGPERTEKFTANRVSQVPLFHIEMSPREERDRILAKHLADKHLTQIKDSKLRERAIEQLVKRAGGSAIWLRMAMESMATAKLERHVEEDLEFLKTNPRVVDWYNRLFEDATDSSTRIRPEILERALETLAVARRPLTIEELARAANMNDAEDRASLDVLSEETAEDDFLSLVRPFVATLEESAGGKKDLRVRLVHRSLQELLLTARPSEWAEMPATTTNKKKGPREKKQESRKSEQRSRELNEQLAARCVKYLLLQDLEDETTSKEAAADTVLPTKDDLDRLQGSEEPSDGLFFGLDDCELFQEPEVLKREQTQAQISHLHFYGYAASHWTSHFAACEEDTTLREDARALLDIAASGCTDWVSLVRAEREAGAPGELFPSSSEPAILAAYFGLHDTLDDILAHCDTVSPPPTTRDEALFWASRGGHERIVKLLLRSGADPNQRLSEEHTALTAAARRGHLGCVQALLADRRTDINVQSKFRKRTALSYAADSSHEAICAALVRRGDCRPDLTDAKGMTPLFYAVGAECLPVISALTALPGVDVNHQDRGGRTALCHSAESGAAASLKQLLDTEGVDVNLPDRVGKTPLTWAVTRGNVACVEALLRHAKTDRTATYSRDRKNAIHFACEAGMHEALVCLLRHGCPGIDDPDVDGWTPLMWAIQNGPACVLSLLATGRVRIDRRDENGRTALFLAVRWGHSVEVARVLLHHGADPETRDDDGQTPLDAAMKRGLPGDFLMADEISSWINRKRRERNAPGA